MIKAAFLTLHKELPWKRQFPKGITKTSDVEFFVPLEEADVVIIYDALPEKKNVAEILTKNHFHRL